MDKTNKILIVVAILAVLGAAFYILMPSERDNLENYEVNNDNTVGLVGDEEGLNQDRPEQISYSENDRQNFEAYLIDNISALSAAPEVLGGEFVISNFNWAENNLVFISYDDGHNAYEAETKLAYDGNNNIIVEYFYDMPVAPDTGLDLNIDGDIMIEDPVLNEEQLLLEQQMMEEEEMMIEQQMMEEEEMMIEQQMMEEEEMMIE